MDVDVDRPTRVLAGRLAAIVPEGFHVEASDGTLCCSADHGRFPGQLGDYQAGTSGTYVSVNFEVHGQTAEQRVAGIVAQALDELQDYVDEATHEPWPGERTPSQAYAEVVTQCCACGTASSAPRPGSARMRPDPAG